MAHCEIGMHYETDVIRCFECGKSGCPTCFLLHKLNSIYVINCKTGKLGTLTSGESEKEQ